MQGILYVSHGSRVPEATSEAVACITSVQQQVKILLQEICFLELAEPNVKQGIANLVNKGATRIAVIPVLLLSAGHYFHDIPKEVKQERLNYPNVSFTYGQPLGVQERFVNILEERIKETDIAVSDDAKILLVGRGSRNPQTKKDIETIGRLLQRKTNFSYVDTCFLAACEPSLEQMLQRLLKEDYSQMVIVPYLWFTGVLMRYLQKKTAEVNTFNKEVILCRHLGDHPIMKKALKERVYESLNEKDV